MSEPHDRPSVPELLEAVRDFIEHDVTPQMEGRRAFLARVAANALAIAQREIELGPRHETDHRARLESLGVASDAELAAAIRAGALDDRYAEVAVIVRASIKDKLAVANPKYQGSR